MKFLKIFKKITIVFLILFSSSCLSEQKKESYIVFAKAKDAVTLDPADIIESESSAVSQNIFETLVRYKDEKTEVEPALAESWSTSKDGKVWIFKIRKNIKFHDGTLCNAKAVKFCYDRQFNKKNPYRYPTSKFEYWNMFFGNVKSIDVIDPLTISFTLSEADPTFLSNMALFTMGVVSPTAIKTYGRNVFKNPVGTGPFKFGVWLQNEKILLKSNPEYWGGEPKIKKLIFKPVPDNSVRLLELENDYVSGIDGINPDDIPRIEKNKDLKILSQAGMNVGYLAMNNEKPPFDNKKVRLAITYAINKEAMVKAFFAGGKIGMSAKNLLSPTVWGYNDDIQPHKYNKEKAKQLIKESKVDLSKTFELWTLPISRPYMPHPYKIAESIQSDLRDIGIKTKIVSYEWGTYFSKVSKGEHDMCLLGWIGDNGDPDNFLYTLLASRNTKKGSASNYAFYKSSEMDMYLDEAKRVLDKEDRTKLYMKAQEVFHKDAPFVPLFHSMQLVGFRKNVYGYKLHPIGAKIFKNVYVE